MKWGQTKSRRISPISRVPCGKGNTTGVPSTIARFAMVYPGRWGILSFSCGLEKHQLGLNAHFLRWNWQDPASDVNHRDHCRPLISIKHYWQTSIIHYPPWKLNIPWYATLNSFFIMNMYVTMCDICMYTMNQLLRLAYYPLWRSLKRIIILTTWESFAALCSLLVPSTRFVVFYWCMVRNAEKKNMKNWWLSSRGSIIGGNFGEAVTWHTGAVLRLTALRRSFLG